MPNGSGGYIVIEGTWPAMARTVWRDPQRYLDSYWRRYADRGYFFAGDGAKYDEDGYIWLLGRVDDVINVSGHRLSTIEIESALVAHPAVAEAGVVAISDDTTGQAVAAFVIPATDPPGTPEEYAALSSALTGPLRAHVTKEIGPIAKPAKVIAVPDLPKTRSGKIMRRLLVDLAEERELGDVTSLQDDTVPVTIQSVLTVLSARSARSLS